MTAACVMCGDQRRLRFDRARGGFVCVETCAGPSNPAAPPRRRRTAARPRREALFNGYLDDNGERRRATRDESREAHRLWTVHRDIREGRAA